MDHWHFSHFLTEGGWESDCYISCDEYGRITNVSKPPEVELNSYTKIAGLSIPSFLNAHSHAFQYAIAGLGELFPREAGADDFWSWRRSMYEMALSLSPAAVESIAAMVYLKMLKAGYSHVAEFHYIHKDSQGNAYEPLAEMSLCLTRAAERVGIGLTILPVYYRSGNFGEPASPAQRRFVFANVREYLALVDNLRQSLLGSSTKLGLGVHSLRAASIEEVLEVSSNCLNGEVFHLHIAEQQKEVADCLSYHNKRPVELLLDSRSDLKNFFLVHATHLNDNEVSRLAASEARVVLCPTTEANLADGIFPLNNFIKQGGQFCIGSDSHIAVDPLEELRLLDYGQRLRSHRRLSIDDVNDPAALLFEHCCVNGQAALGLAEDAKSFKIGSKLNVITFSGQEPLLAARKPDLWLATLIYALGGVRPISVIADGNQVISEGSHQLQSEIYQEFEDLLKSI